MKLIDLKKLLRRLTVNGLRHNRHQRRAKIAKLRRILGFSLADESPIYEPDDSSSAIVYAASGGGKTTSVAIPHILSFFADLNRGMVINDVKDGEIVSQLIALCEKYGRLLAIIDDSYVLGKDNPYRVAINPFANLIAAFERESPDLMLEVENVANIVIPEPKDDARNTYFRQVPREFIELAILILLVRNTELATPGGVAALLADPELWNSAVDVEVEEGGELTRSRANQIRELRENDPEHYSQHLLAALSALRIFQPGGPLHEAGRAADVSHEQLLKDNYIVCLVQSQRNAARLSTYYGAHFNAFISAQMRGDCGKTDFVFDEAANTPAKDMIEKVTIQRAFGVRTIFIAQSRADMQRQYSDKLISTLEDNCRVVQWLKFANIEEAERVSRAIGDWNTVSQSLNTNSGKIDFSIGHQLGRERAASADELMRMPGDVSLTAVSGVGYFFSKMPRQNQLAPYCFEIGVNRVEKGILPPDPRITLPTPDDFEGQR